MRKSKVTRMARTIKAKTLYQRAHKHWRRGQLRSAFRLFLAAAKASMVPAFSTLGQFYDRGDGVRANEDAALYWYGRAYRHGDYSSANNIGCIWRDRKKFSRAISWLERAAKLGDGDANLNIAKIYLHNKHDLKKAIRYLNATCNADHVTEASKEEARRLLKQVTRRTTKRR